MSDHYEKALIREPLKSAVSLYQASAVSDPFCHFWIDFQHSTIELKKTRSKTKLPLCVGFGISKHEHISEVLSSGAEGAIVGSALVVLYLFRHSFCKVSLIERPFSSNTRKYTYTNSVVPIPGFFMKPNSFRKKFNFNSVDRCIKDEC